MASGRTRVAISAMQTEADWKWWSTQSRVPLATDARGLIAFQAGAPAAGVVFQNWLPASVEIHHSLRKPTVLRHGWLDVIAQAGFGEHRKTLYSLVSADLKKALKFDKHIGFKEVGRIPNGDSEGVDLVVLVLERHEFKYWKENNSGWRIAGRS